MELPDDIRANSTWKVKNNWFDDEATLVSTKGNTQKLATLFEDTNALTKVKEVMEPRPMDIKQHEASCLEEGTGASSSSSGANPGDVGSDVASASGFAQEAGPVSVAMEQDLIAPSTPAKSRAPRVGAPAMAFSSATAGGIPLGRVALPVASRRRTSSPAQCQDRERTALSAFPLLSHGHTHIYTQSWTSDVIVCILNHIIAILAPARRCM